MTLGRFNYYHSELLRRLNEHHAQKDEAAIMKTGHSIRRLRARFRRHQEERERGQATKTRAVRPRPQKPFPALVADGRVFCEEPDCAICKADALYEREIRATMPLKMLYALQKFGNPSAIIRRAIQAELHRHPGSTAKTAWKSDEFIISKRIVVTVAMREEMKRRGIVPSACFPLIQEELRRMTAQSEKQALLKCAAPTTEKS